MSGDALANAAAAEPLPAEKRSPSRQGQTRLLAGVRVLDITSGEAAFCSRLLADLGATVVKVEPPGGDPARYKSPLLSGAGPDRSLSFRHWNSGKLSICLDPAHNEDRKTLGRLLAVADVLIADDFPTPLARWGWDEASLHAAYPQLVITSLTGFGCTGPRRWERSSGLVAAAAGGQMAVTGFPEGPPLALPGNQPAALASLFGATGTLLALRCRGAEGAGGHVDVSLQEAAAASLDHVFVRYFTDGTVAGREGGRHWNGTFCILPCRDGHILATLNLHWDTLVGWLEDEGMAAELGGTPWRDEAYRQANSARLAELMARWTSLHGREELAALAQALGFPWAPVRSLAEVLQDKQLHARSFFTAAAQGQEHGGPPLLGTPYRFDGTPPPRSARVPLPGKDTVRLRREWLLPQQEAPTLLSARGKNEHTGGSGPGQLPQQRWRKRRRHPTGPLAALAGGETNGSSAERSMAALALAGSACNHASMSSASSSRTDLPPLAGIRVLDFTRVLAGPYASRLLADFGADVIKVQSRTVPQAEMTDYYRAWNRNKRSITLAMGHPEAAALALRLASRCDVVMENFSPRVMENWGLTDSRLRAQHSELIILHLSAVGQTGPDRNNVAYASTLHARSGLTSLVAAPDGSPAGPGFSYADVVAGLYAALAVLAALARRDRTGQGCSIDLSALEALCSLLGPEILGAWATAAGTRGEEAVSPAVPCGAYPCAGQDRWCAIETVTEEQWQALCALMGNPSWTREERFATAVGQRIHGKEIEARIRTWTASHDARHLAARLQACGLAAALVQNARDLAYDEHLWERGFFVTIADPERGETIGDHPLRLEGLATEHWRPAPRPDQDNEAFYRGLIGMSEAQYQHYLREGIIV